jgi:HlyD family secretion protein
VKEIYADFKTPVRKGEVLARLDPARVELRLSEARAEPDAAKREALLKRAAADLERTLIRAPIDGTVILRNADVGQSVTADVRSPLFTIAADLREMQLEAPIEEADAQRLRAGMPATFSVEALPRRSFSGEVRQVRKSTVLVAAANPDLALLPGMTARLRIALEERANVLKLPDAALRWKPGHVWVLEHGEPKPIAVRTGISDGKSTELVAGPLAEGAQVIVGTVGK